MKLLTDIPFEIDTADLLKKVRAEPGTGDAASVETLIARAAKIGRPKAMYRESWVDAVDGDTVTIDGIAFESRTLAMNLDGVGRVFPFIATCGRELDEAGAESDDFLADFWWDTIKAALLAAAIKYMNSHLDTHFLLPKTSAMSPGSGDTDVWPIEQQRGLFALFGGRAVDIGVELTGSFLMIPNKTISGIRFTTESDFRSCKVCRRENCVSRSAVFDRELWESIQRG